MEIIEIQTLVDITNTGVKRANQGNALEFSQYKNWITLNQCIEIRSIINYETNPTVETVDLKGLGFGSKYKGKQQVWKFRFNPDRSDAFKSEDLNPVGLLEESLNQVPVIKNLSESVNIDVAVFDCFDKVTKNIIVKYINGNE